MSFHTVNGQHVRPGFNNYRYGCGHSRMYGYGNNMSMNGSILPRGYCDPSRDRGTFIQQPNTETETSTWEQIWDGICIAMGNCGSLFGSCISKFFS